MIFKGKMRLPVFVFKYFLPYGHIPEFELLIEICITHEMFKFDAVPPILSMIQEKFANSSHVCN